MSDHILKAKRSVYFWEDHISAKLRESAVGRKGLSLFELKDMDIPIPDFFVVSSSVFDKVVSNSLVREAKTLLVKDRNPEETEVTKALLKTDFDEETLDQILSAYARISGFTDAWVSVRSSVVFPSAPEVSFSGIFTTELNVRGSKDLLESIKRVYASLFTDDVVMYASSKGLNLADVKLAVVVQKMIQSEVSGVAFTVDPITQDPTKLSIEAVFGLGDTISLGELTPDTYLLNKKDLQLLEKKISPQEWMKIRILEKGSKRENTQKVTISNSWSHRQKIEDKYLKEIAKISLIVENKLRRAQNIEWVMSGGKMWVLQSKDLYEKYTPSPAQLSNATKFDTLGEVLRWSAEQYEGIGILEDKTLQKAQRIVTGNKHEYDSVTEKLVNIAKGQVKKVEEKKDVVKREDFVLKGLGASFGVVVGNVVLVEKGSNVSVSKNSILVIKEYSSEMESLIINSGGVILESGGITSDTAILCREFDIPAVVGAKGVSTLFKSGELIRVDGNTGSIYREREHSEPKSIPHPVLEAYKEENLSGVDFLKQEESTVVGNSQSKERRIPHDMNIPPCATKVFVNPLGKIDDLVDLVGNSHGLVYIDLDRILIENGRHLLAYVEDKKFVEYSKEISEKICEYVELAEGNQVVLALGSTKVSDFRALVKGKQLENTELDDSTYGLTHYLSNKELLSRVLKIVRRVRNVYKKRNVDIAIYAPRNEGSMKEFKKSLLAGGLRRTATFRVYAILDNPTDIILADEILDAKIDGLILDMPRVVRVMQGFKVDDVKARYNLGINSSLKILDTVCDISKQPSKEIIVLAEDNKDLIKYSVQKGVYGVSVLPQAIKEMRHLVSQEEAKLILGKK